MQLDPHRELLQAVPHPRSSTHCELLALQLVREISEHPQLVLTDSLCSLQLIRGWSSRSTAEVLDCEERAEVRKFILQWADDPHPPELEKVKARDAKGLADGNPKSLGNDRADYLAKPAVAAGRGHDAPREEDPRFADAVRVRDEHGAWVGNVKRAFALKWWELRRAVG